MSVAYVKSDGTLVTQLSVGADNILDVNVVGAVIPPPVGGATEAEQQAQTALLTSIDANLVACNTGAVVVSSSALPTGAATAAKQPALGTAGTASADVITVQGIAGMTSLKVDGSAVTQPISAASLPLPTSAATNLAVAQPTTSVAITPSDSTDLTATVTKGLWVGTAGNVAIKLSADSAAVVLSNVPSGTYVPGAFARVMATNTTATNIVGFGG